MLIVSIFALTAMALWLVYSIFKKHTFIAEYIGTDREPRSGVDELVELKTHFEKELQIEVTSIKRLDSTRYLVEYRK